MKFCPNCGVKLDNDNFKFCPECGYKFGSDTNNSNQSEKSEPKGFIDGFIKGLRNQVPEEYVEKIKNNETIDDAVTQAKIIWRGPQTEKEKAYKERKRQEEEKKDPIKYKISEVTGKHLLDSPYFTERKKLFNVTDGYTYYKDILKWEVDNGDLEYDDIEARLDELLKINDARTIFQLRFKYPTCLFKTREDLEQYIKYGDVKNPISMDDEKMENNVNQDSNHSASLKNIQSEETDEKEKVIKQTDEPSYSDFELSDLQESLIKSLPVITNPLEYEENIINKYAEYNSEERKELLKDCWTVTKLANEHNIKRHEVEKAILTDEFLNKDLIGVFKVNPNNIRSLKILYRKLLTEKQEAENSTAVKEDAKDVKEIPKEEFEEETGAIVDEIIEGENVKQSETTEEKQVNVESQVEDKLEVEQEVSVDKNDIVTEEPIEEKIKSSQGKTVNPSNKTTQNKKKKNNKKKQRKYKKRGIFFDKRSPEQKKFDDALEYYTGEKIGSLLGSHEDYFSKREAELNIPFGGGQPKGNIRTILREEFAAGTLSINDIESRMDDLMVLDTLSLINFVLDEGYDTSLIKTQDDLYEFLKENEGIETADKSKLKMKIKFLGATSLFGIDGIEEILEKEVETGKLSMDNIENRLGELRNLDSKSLRMYVLDKGHDTSLIKTQDDLYEFLKENESVTKAEFSNENVAGYREGKLFEKYDINTEEAYCFQCTIEERKSSTFSNTDKRNVDTAYVALYDDYMVIIKESVWLKSDMGMRKVYFNNVTSIDYDTSGKLGMSSSLFIHMHSGEHVQLKFITKTIVDEIHKRYENFTNKKESNNNVTTIQESSNADELLKYAELYKQGLLSEEEFEAKKKELL